MLKPSDLIRGVVLNSRIATARRRKEIERELLCHIEDVAAELRTIGCTDEQIVEQILRRFGDPDELANGFRELHKSERIATRLIVTLCQLAGSFVVAGALISIVQLSVALGRGISVGSALVSLRLAMFGFAALAFGYVGSDLADRATRGSSASASFATRMALTVTFAVILTALVPGHVLAPAVACGSAATVHFLERTGVRFAALIGAAGPVLMGWALVGPLIVGQSHLPPLVAPIVVTLDVAATCEIMRRVIPRIERRLVEVL